MTETPEIKPRRSRALPIEPAPDPKDVLDPRLVPLDSLRPASWNPRSIKSERLKNLMSSMEADPEFLRLRPILAMSDGTIYAGNRRWEAAYRLGRQAVWAVVGDVEPQIAKERAVRDNNEWGEWDDDQLTDMLRELESMGSDISLLGFDDKALESLMKGDSMPTPGDQATEDAPKMWGVIVTLESESKQVELLTRLSEEGFAVRALMA